MGRRILLALLVADGVAVIVLLIVFSLNQS
jgi:hypothetical protein